MSRWKYCIDVPFIEEFSYNTAKIPRPWGDLEAPPAAYHRRWWWRWTNSAGSAKKPMPRESWRSSCMRPCVPSLAHGCWDLTVWLGSSCLGLEKAERLESFLGMFPTSNHWIWLRGCVQQWGIRKSWIFRLSPGFANPLKTEYSCDVPIDCCFNQHV